MRTALARSDVDYDGGQLRSGWLAGELLLDPGEDGAVGAFLGSCDVKPEFVVDRDEIASGEPIRAARMLHFIAEFSDTDLEKTVLRQRLLATVVRDELASRVSDRQFARKGDDLYEGEYKLSVSIATLSPKSALIHFAINVDPTGAPVPARGLDEYGVDPGEFARAVLASFDEEMRSSRAAVGKVRPVP